LKWCDYYDWQHGDNWRKCSGDYCDGGDECESGEYWQAQHIEEYLRRFSWRAFGSFCRVLDFHYGVYGECGDFAFYLRWMGLLDVMN
jgi:hypothetical protein